MKTFVPEINLKRLLFVLWGGLKDRHTNDTLNNSDNRAAQMIYGYMDVVIRWGHRVYIRAKGKSYSIS